MLVNNSRLTRLLPISGLLIVLVASATLCVLTLPFACDQKIDPQLNRTMEELRSEDPLIREQALRSLWEMTEHQPELHPPRSLRHCQKFSDLVGALEDTHSPVRSLAARLLGRLQCEPTTAVPALARGLKDPEAAVRHECINALAAYAFENKMDVHLVLPDIIAVFQDGDAL